jgi:hypothetical protein
VNQKTWELAKGLLGEALDQPTAEREAYVRARCTDPALLEEIQAYLRESKNIRTFETQKSHRIRSTPPREPPGLDEEMSSFVSGQSSALADPTRGAQRAAVGHASPQNTQPANTSTGRAIPANIPPDPRWVGTAQVRDRPPVHPSANSDPATSSAMSLITNAPRMADVVVHESAPGCSTASEFHDLADSHPRSASADQHGRRSARNRRTTASAARTRRYRT